MKLQNAKLPMEYDNYVFDLYGTLVDIHTDENCDLLWEKLAMFYGYYGANYTPDELKKAYSDMVESKEKSDTHEAHPEIEITTVFKDLFKEKGIDATDELSVHAGQFFRVLSTEYVKLYEGTKEMLKSLKDNGKKVFLLSNAQRIFTEYEMRRLDIFKYFDKIYISSDHGTKKPNSSFFEILLNETGIDVKKSLFIGNDSKCDIKGAGVMGFDTFYVKSNISPQNDSAPDATYEVNEFLKWEF